MTAKIFLTGATGYVGGHFLDYVVAKHPEYQIAALVRNEGQSKIIKSSFPAVETVIGDLDNEEVLASEASKADVVLNLASADHIPAAVTLIKGIAQGKKDGRLIHISGTGIMTDLSNGPGEATEKVYNDTSAADINTILSFDLSHIHRDVEEAVVAAAKQYGVKAAILSPPTIHGVGKGPVKKRSIQVPILIESALKKGKAFQVLEGRNIWNGIHVDDLANAITLLSEEVLKKNGKATYLPEGYYFAETGEFRWGDVSAKVAAVAHAKGLIDTVEVEKLTVEAASAIHPWAPVLWGGNSRGTAQRLKDLGWKPSGKGIFDSLEAMVDFEAAASEAERQKLTFEKA